MSVGTYSEHPVAKAGKTDGFSVPWSRPRPKRNGISARLISAVTILVLLAAWALSASLQLASPVFLPSPAAVWAKFVIVGRDGFVDATLAQHLAASLWRVFAALIAAIIVGVPVGLAIEIDEVRVLGIAGATRSAAPAGASEHGPVLIAEANRRAVIRFLAGPVEDRFDPVAAWGRSRHAGSGSFWPEVLSGGPCPAT